jgi:hypothetical protein
MARPQAFERELRLATAGLEPDAIAKLLAKTARQALAEAQAQGVTASTYVRTVNGREGVSEDSVVPPGPIVYTFNYLPEVATYALAYAEERSPVESGRFKRSWFVLANGSVVTDMAEIPLDAEIIVTNDEPYARKIEVGRTEAGRPFVLRVPPGIVEDTRQAVLRRFGNVIRAERQFIPLAGAYRLHTSHKSGRKDRRAGRDVTYPALVISHNF